MIGIFGLGYVGLPLALRFTSVGFRVIGFDIDIKRSIVNKGGSYIDHIKAERIADAVKKGFTPTTDFRKPNKPMHSSSVSPHPLTSIANPIFRT